MLLASRSGPSARCSLCCVKAPWPQIERCYLLPGQRAGEAADVCSARRLLGAGDQTLEEDTDDRETLDHVTLASRGVMKYKRSNWQIQASKILTIKKWVTYKNCM